LKATLHVLEGQGNLRLPPVSELIQFGDETTAVPPVEDPQSFIQKAL
jgi:hypothetical protein